jgi:hypothetical protein
MTQAQHTPHAIRDNAQDDGVAIPLDLVASFKRLMTTSSLHLQKPLLYETHTYAT